MQTSPTPIYCNSMIFWHAFLLSLLVIMIIHSSLIDL